jgi:hypothetical protein
MSHRPVVPPPKPRPVQVINDGTVTAEILASAIVAIASAANALRSGRLTDRALLILIQDACPTTIGLDKIRMVLDAIGNLKKKYVK